jgi:hypothetical protein
MATDSDHQKIAEHALAMLKAVYLREGPDAAVWSAKYMVEAAAIVITEALGPAETRGFLHVVGVRQGREH